MFITEDFFTQANTLKRGLCSVQVAQELLRFHKPTFIGLDLRCGLCQIERSHCTLASQHLSAWIYLCGLHFKESQSVSKCLTSVSKCHILKETIVCLELSRVLFILINWVSSLLDCCCCSLKNTSKYGDLYWTIPFKDRISNDANDVEENPGPTIFDIIDPMITVSADYSQGNEALFGENAGKQCVVMSLTAIISSSRTYQWMDFYHFE